MARWRIPFHESGRGEFYPHGSLLSAGISLKPPAALQSIARNPIDDHHPSDYAAGTLGPMTPEQLPFLAAAVLVVAFVYSSVGHAGASGYIAVMSLFSLAPGVIKPTALLLNILVASIGAFQFWRAGHFSWRLFWPFALLSIPAGLWLREILAQFKSRRHLQIVDNTHPSSNKQPSTSSKHRTARSSP